MSASRPYTDEQIKVVQQPVTSRSIIHAAAGTGKTHVLAGRLAYLIEAEGLSAGDDVLVLSFSRAAVAELQRRVERLQGDARFVGAATFDSFATRLLATEYLDGALWSGQGYDRRIAMATQLVRGQNRPQLLHAVRHLLIDEVQDLTGSRARLVLALLETLDCGFTLFGDPAQAIYGYQSDGSSVATDAKDFYTLLRESSVVRPNSWSLTRDLRSAGPDAYTVAAIGARLRSEEPDHESIADELRALTLGLPPVTVLTARRMLRRDSAGATAILCRTNGEALRMSDALFEHEIAHRLQRRAEHRAAAPWLGAAVLAIEGDRTTRTELMSSLRAIDSSASLTTENMYAIIRKLSPGRRDEIDLRFISERLRSGVYPEELNFETESSVVVSTVHRAKGLEFDRVLLCETDIPRSDLANENRVRYVALSRARSEIFSISRPDTRGLSVDRSTGRWVRRGFGPNRWRVYELEVHGGDTDAASPAGAWIINADVRTTQQYLAAAVLSGDAVDLHLVDGDADGEVHYVVKHNGMSIGITGTDFGDALHRLLRRSRPPVSIDGLRVELVDTVGGDPLTGAASGLGRHGLWLRARIFGLGLLQFDSTRN